jgi:hypothetical protein
MISSVGILDEFTRINPILAKWHKTEWVFYFLIIPTALYLVYLLPDALKQSLVLNPKQPTPISIFANHYIHDSLDHLTSNLVGYLLSVGLIFNIETSKTRFHRVTVFFLIGLPIITSLILVIFFPFNVSMFGFSAIVSALIGYIVYATYAYLQKRYAYIRTSFVVILLLVNLTILFINNNYAFARLAAVAFVIFMISERRIILNLFKDLTNELKTIPKNAWLELIYKIILVAYLIIFVFSLPSLIPANIVSGTLIVNTPIHFMGWMFGLFLPWTCARSEEMLKEKASHIGEIPFSNQKINYPVKT